MKKVAGTNIKKALLSAALAVCLFEFPLVRGGMESAAFPGPLVLGVAAKARPNQGGQVDFLQNYRTDLVGSWSSGVWARNSNTGVWSNLESSSPSLIAAGDIDGDGTDDLVGVWPGSGLWVKHSSMGSWLFIGTSPSSLAVADTNGDHKAEIVGIWASVVWSRDGASGSWTSLTTGGSQIALGDMDGDGKADLVGTWPDSGVWVKYASTQAWTNLTTSPAQIACGDLNGDGKSDLLGIWSGTIWARDSVSGIWTSLTSGADFVTAGDLDGDGKDDLIGSWTDNGVWVKYSSTGAWSHLSTSAPQSLTTMRQPSSGAGCPQPNGLTIDHRTDITTSETWAGDGTLHKVSVDITVRPGATLTLAPCASIQVAVGKSFTVRGDPGNPAKFVSAGTADKPVLISNIPGGGNWAYLRNLTVDSSADLSYTALQNGGNGTYHGATLDFHGLANPATTVVRMVRADHLVVKNSAGTGILMETGAAFTADSTDITVTGGGSVIGGGDSAIEITQLAVGTLPALHVSGNARDQIRVASGSLLISRDLRIKNLGVPYYFVFDRVRVTDPSGVFTPTLTVDPGVELRFDDYLRIGEVTAGNPNRPGKLLALGTPAQPIVFTSSKTSKAAGDWPGVFLNSAPGSRIENSRIEYAGGFNGIASANCKPNGTNDHAGLFIGDGYIPSPSDFVNVTISNSASHGINAMWSAGGFGPNLTGAFTFQNIRGCRQTLNGMPGGCKGTTGCLVP